MANLNQQLRRTYSQKLAGLERDIAMSLCLTNGDARRIVCSISVRSPGKPFPDELLIGSGFEPGDDDTCDEPMREFVSFGVLAQAVQQLAGDLHADLGSPCVRVEVVARHDQQSDGDQPFCLGVVDTTSAVRAAV